MATSVKTDKIETKHYWAVDEDRTAKPIRAIIQDSIEPGLWEYTCTVAPKPFPNTLALRPMAKTLVTDSLLNLPGSLSEYLIKSAESFWKEGPAYEALGVVHKRGLMVEGAPGCGKTVSCLMAGREIGKRGGLAIFVSPTTFIADLPDFLQDVRDTQPDIPLMVIFEDIDKHVPDVTAGNAGMMSTALNTVNMHMLLSLLDGERQIQNVIYIATTNFIDKIDPRLTERRSRFDEVIKAKTPNTKTRRAYFTQLNKLDPSLNPALVEASKGLNYADMKELAICACIYHHDIQKTSDRLHNVGGNRSAGFSADTETEED